jgi:phage terminase large subunit
MLLLEGIQRPLRILACREFLSAVSSSLHRLFSDQIRLLNLNTFYRIETAAIYGPQGTEIRFAGIRNNIEAIRSYEGCDVTYCEEAENVSYDSWEVLIPTVIRKPGSCMIIGFNPMLAKANTYQRWVVSPPPNTVVTKINYTDNPFLSEESRDLAEHLKLTDPDAYNNIWLGFPKTEVTGAIWGPELRLAQQEHRLTKVPYDRSVAVSTFWDLGRADSTAIIFAQVVAMQFRVIDYIEDSGKSIHEYLKMLQEKPYIYAIDWLPHDARAHVLGSKRSIEETLKSNGRRVQIVPRLSVADSIAAARLIWPNVWIDESRCTKLIDCLREYRFDDAGKPVHDQYSHGGDAWRYLSIALRGPKPIKPAAPSQDEPWARFSGRSSNAWMDV